MMNSSERRLKLILTLQSDQQLNARELAEKFNVSRRTIFRDLKVLNKMEIPITWDKYSGYGIMPGYKMPPIMFTSQELATVIVGLSFAQSQVDKQLAEDAKNVELKIRNVVPGELKEFMSSLNKKTIVDPYLKYGAEKKKGGNWYLITSAISQKKRISFDYITKGDDKYTSRKIDPYLIVFFRDHWNTIGYSHKRSSIRNFLLSSMKNIQIVEEEYEEKKDINPERLIFRSERSSHKIVVEVDASVESRFMANLPAKIIKKYSINSKLIKVVFAFDNLDYINEWLLQFSDKIKIIEPSNLIKKRKKLLKQLLNIF